MENTKKPVIIFSIADDNNLKLAENLENSLKKFHPDVPFHLVSGEELKDYLETDPNFFYRATPIIGEKLLKEYELVIKIDADSIICGDISYIWNTKDYDIGGVLNFNQIDAQTYGIVEGWGINAMEYMNCGLVAMRNEQFVHNWTVWCFSPQFDRLRFREQDGLNALVYHGNWNVRIFDHGDGPAKMTAFWGLFAKTYWPNVIYKDGKMVIPAVEGGIPLADTELKVIHFGTGNTPNKGNYRTLFNETVVKHLDYLTSK